jgi:hypothetical protein
MTPSVVRCAGCHEVAELDETLEIVAIKSGATFYVHRPATGKPCFRWKVGPAWRDRIATPRKVEDEGP